ncbi:MAG TPA: class I SAM-dependent methyltransferase [Pyrinomonadaceae bacterium]|nr:class I SAM-dependent methyltransferase [Pyrinomonadaceae bacterium]
MTDYLKKSDDYNNADVASVFDELSFWSSRFGALLFKHMEIRGRLRILDLGCATGFPLFELAHVHGPSCQLTGIDVWKDALERARMKLKVYDLSNVQILEADGARQPFPDSEFDLIVSNLGINNFADPEAVLSECWRVAKPGARIILTTNIKGHYKEFYEVFREILEASGRTESLEKLGANEDHRGTKQQACELLQRTGWSVGRIIEDSFEMRFLDGTALFNHSLTRFGFLGGWRSVVNTEDEEKVFGVIEEKLNAIARQNGGLRMTVPMLYVEGEKS